MIQTEEDIDKLALAILGRLPKFFLNGVEKPLTKTELADFLKYSPRHIDKLTEQGILKPHRLYDGADPRYFASEAVDILKNQRKPN
jgi:hypothetical protein